MSNQVPAEIDIDTDSLQELSRKPVDVRTFLTDPNYLGSSCSDLTDRTVAAVSDVFSGNRKDQIRVSLSGSESTRFGQICLARVLYEISCRVDPQASIGVIKDSNITVAIIDQSSERAIELSTNLAYMLKQSPYFSESFSHEQKDRSHWKFPNLIWLVGRSSADSSIRGLNVVSALIVKGSEPQEIPSRSLITAADVEEVTTHWFERRIRALATRTKFRGRVFIAI